MTRAFPSAKLRLMDTGAGDAAGGAVVETAEEAGVDPEAEAPEGEEPAKAGEQLTDGELLEAVAALIYASPEPLAERKIASLLEGPEPARVRAAIEALGQRLEASGLPLELRSIAGGWQILTSPRMGEIVRRLFQERKVERISPAALETLAVVAYRQPVTKAEIEAIRGVQAGPILRSLVERGLVRVVGRADVPGHPLQYGTSKEFLDRFGLGGVDDLPRDSELAR